MSRPIRPGFDLKFTLLFTVLYVPVAQLGMMLALPPGNVTPVYPAAALAWVAALFFGRTAYLGILLGGMLGNLISFFDPEQLWACLLTGLAIGIGEALSSWVGVLLFRRFAGPQASPLGNLRSTTVFVIVGSLWWVSPTVGVTSLWLGGFLAWEAYPNLWLTWWLGDALGILVAAPILISHRLSASRWKDLWRPEGWWLILLTLGLGSLVLSTSIFLIFLMVPVSIWAAARFGTRGASLITLLISCFGIAALLTADPLASVDQNTRLLVLQGFLGMVTISALFLSVVIRRQQEAVTQLMYSTRQASVGDMAVAICHKLNQPLQSINLSAGLALDALESEAPDEAKREVESIETAVDEAASITGRLRLWGRRDSRPVFEPTRLSVLVEDALLFSDVIGHLRGIIMTTEKGPVEGSLESDTEASVDAGDVEVRCDRFQIGLVLSSVLANAVEAVESSDEKSIVLRYFAERERAVVEIEDSGDGIDPTRWNQIFEPFFSDRGEQQTGRGLGLSVAAEIVAAHKGKLEVVRGSGQGACLRLTLPRLSESGPGGAEYG